MLSFYIFFATLVAILGISSYAYEQLKVVTDNSEVSRKLLLSNLIIASVVLFFVFFFRFINYIDHERGSNFLSFGTLITSIIMILSYSYLDKERTSDEDYDVILEDLNNIQNNTNQKERDLSLIIGIIGLGIVAAYLFILMGKIFYSKTITHTITVKEPLILQSVDEKPIKIDYDALRKKFIN